MSIDVFLNTNPLQHTSIKWTTDTLKWSTDTCEVLNVAATLRFREEKLLND